MEKPVFLIPRERPVIKDSIRQILIRNKLRANKNKFINLLKERYFHIRLEFSVWFQGEMEEYFQFPLYILWTDEASIS